MKYVFSYSGPDPEVIIVEANSEAEAVGKATELNYGVAPIADPEPLEDVMEDGGVKLA